jgi:type IV pilus assembly protein PilQ
MTVSLVISAHGQDRYADIETRMQALAKETPGLNEKVELSVNGVAIQEFIRGLAMSNNLNISVDPSLSAKIFNNFSDVTVTDVLMFLVRKYDLEVTFIGSIMSFSQYVSPPQLPVVHQRKPINITYDKEANLLSFDLNNDSLFLVAKEITRVTQKNVVFAPSLAGRVISGYIQNTPFGNALEKLAFANDLKVTPTSDNFYLIEKKDAETAVNTGKQGNNRTGTSAAGSTQATGFNVSLSGSSRITVDAVNAPIADILDEVSSQLHTEYFIFSELKGNTSLNISDVTYDEFLKYLFNGTAFTSRKEGSVYMMGDRDIEGLRQSKVIQLKYRTAEKVTDLIPAALKKDVDIKHFPDLNGFIVSGSQPAINELEMFLREIDRVVPVVVIEVMIVDVRNSHAVSTGIKAGLKDQPTVTSGTVFPSANLTLGAGAINAIITGLNGFGIVNLGKVTPNFYINISALEEQGMLKIHSTPKLATLNGHEAKMSIGKTEYYLEETNNVIGSQNPQNVITKQYKPITADLSVSINPMVSSDEQITLDVKVKQASFTERISQTAPPGTISRDFESLIRVKNEETIILGGLEEDTRNDSGSGVPVISRVPVLKWFFSSRTKSRSKSKLMILIKPTVIY